MTQAVFELTILLPLPLKYWDGNVQYPPFLATLNQSSYMLKLTECYIFSLMKYQFNHFSFQIISTPKTTQGPRSLWDIYVGVTVHHLRNSWAEPIL